MVWGIKCLRRKRILVFPLLATTFRQSSVINNRGPKNLDMAQLGRMSERLTGSEIENAFVEVLAV